MLASFHGDTNGLATIPVVKAVEAVAKSKDDARLLFGLDANTYHKGQAGKAQDVMEFAEAYLAMGLTSCWGDQPDPTNFTTYNARTFLQPQLNKVSRHPRSLGYGQEAEQRSTNRGPQGSIRCMESPATPPPFPPPPPSTQTRE